ncbi:Sorting nexin-4 [Yarrowia lipolytica]|nr:Sorting nexin-4 [Yarrowia lipolytica]
MEWQDEAGPSSGPSNGIASSSNGPSSHSDTDLYRSDYHALENDKTYIDSVVSDPAKDLDGTQNAHITYLVTTKSNNTQFSNKEFRVRRRFSDFVFLYNCLNNEFQACVVPPLPDKQRLEYIRGDRFSTEFTVKRAASLTRFLSRIAHHPLLKRSKYYHAFLESGEWNAYKKNNIARGGLIVDGGILDGLSDTLVSAFTRPPQTAQEFQEVKERIDRLDVCVSHIEKVLARSVRRQSDLVMDFQDLSQHVGQLEHLIPSLEQEFSKFAGGLQALAINTAVLKEKLDTDYVSSLKDLMHYLVSVRALLKQRDQKQADYEGLVEYNERAVAERQALVSGGGNGILRNKLEDIRGINHEFSRRERLQKLEGRIESLTGETNLAKTTSEAFDEQTKREINTFDKIRSGEMKETLKTLTSGQVDFYAALVKDWEAIYDALGE